MEENKTVPKFGITPLRIKTIQLMIDERGIPLDVVFRVDLNNDLKISTENSMAFLDFEVLYYIGNEDGSERKVLACTVQNVFRIENMDELKEENGFVVLPDDVFITMVSLSISHTRAVLSMHTAGTAFGDTLMPIINPVDATKAFITAMQKDKGNNKAIIFEPQP